MGHKDLHVRHLKKLTMIGLNRIFATFRLYRCGARRLMSLFQEMHPTRTIHYRDFTAFGTTDLIDPQPDILQLLDANIKSPSIKSWSFHVYQRIVLFQMSSALKHQDKFITLIQVKI